MELRVRTANGGSFLRCKMTFGPEWTTVSSERLDEKFATPEATKNSPTVREILKGEKMLVCEDVPELEPADGNGKPGKKKPNGNGGK